MDTTDTNMNNSTETPSTAPKRVEIRSKWRDINSRGRGSEFFRLAATIDSTELCWIDQHPDALSTARGFARGIRASERHSESRVEVPVGLLVITVEKSTSGGPASYRAGIVGADADGDGVVDRTRVKHAGIKRVGAAWVHVVEVDGVRREYTSAD